MLQAHRRGALGVSTRKQLRSVFVRTCICNLEYARFFANFVMNVKIWGVLSRRVARIMSVNVRALRIPQCDLSRLQITQY